MNYRVHAQNPCSSLLRGSEKISDYFEMGAILRVKQIRVGSTNEIFFFIIFQIHFQSEFEILFCNIFHATYLTDPYFTECRKTFSLTLGIKLRVIPLAWWSLRGTSQSRTAQSVHRTSVLCKTLTSVWGREWVTRHCWESLR